MDCVFCKIVKGEIPSPRVYEDDDFIIIRDIAPQAKYHYLAIPKKHFADVTEMTAEDAALVGRVSPCFQQGRRRNAKRSAPAYPHPRRAKNVG